jgi:hypothetical protein
MDSKRQRCRQCPKGGRLSHAQIGRSLGPWDDGFSHVRRDPHGLQRKHVPQSLIFGINLAGRQGEVSFALPFEPSTRFEDFRCAMHRLLHFIFQKSSRNFRQRHVRLCVRRRSLLGRYSMIPKKVADFSKQGHATEQMLKRGITIQSEAISL